MAWPLVEELFFAASLSGHFFRFSYIITDAANELLRKTITMYSIMKLRVPPLREMVDEELTENQDQPLLPLQVSRIFRQRRKNICVSRKIIFKKKKYKVL